MERSIDVSGLSDDAVAAVEQLVRVLKKEAAPDGGGVETPPSGDEWRRQFAVWMAEVAGRAGRYPAGFVVDDSRESIYEGRGE